jgi:benzoate membrane transport protein
VGAFLVCGALLTLAGLWRPLGRWVAAIPASLAGAMLAGVLLPLCLAPVRAVAALPLLALPVVLAWVAVAAWKRLWAVPAAVVLAVALVALTRTAEQGEPAAALVLPLPVWPDFSAAAVLGIGVPLFLVTMAAQNIPGMAVLAANGYRPEAGRLFAWTGALSLMAAPFGGHALNLAAITAALCAGPEAQPDPARRYWAAAVAGAFYVVFGLLAGAALALVSLAPPLLLQAIAGLALLGTLAGALRQALDSEAEREAATVTFLLSASGVGFLGIGGPFWGLLAGGALLALRRGR